MVTKEKHPLLKRAKDSAAMLPYWDKVDTIIEGYEAVKAAEEEFLPRFAQETSKDYEIRLKFSKFTNIYRDVLEGLASKPFQEEITLIGSDVPQELIEFAENVDGQGNHITAFSSLTFFNAINSAIDWIMVDYPKVETDRPLSRAAAREQGIRPYWVHILGRNVFEVRTIMVGSNEVISYMRVLEPSDGLRPDRIRVYTRPEGGGNIIWELYEENENAREIEDQVVLIDTGLLSIDVIPFVPLITGRREGKSFKIHPVMRDAADLQIILYQEESALQFTKIMSCYPMLAANGIKPEKRQDGTIEKLAVGPMKVLYGPPDGNGNHGEWRFIEPSAHGMEFAKKSIDSTKQDLRELGRQPLTALSSQLTTVTTSIAAGKAKSAVGAWALMLKDALENCFMLTARYMGLDYEVEVNVYTDFDNISDTNADIDNLLTARQNGDLSQETLWFELQRRKVLSPEFDANKERERIINEIPSDMVLEDEPNDEDNDENTIITE